MAPTASCACHQAPCRSEAELQLLKEEISDTWGKNEDGKKELHRDHGLKIALRATNALVVEETRQPVREQAGLVLLRDINEVIPAEVSCGLVPEFVCLACGFVQIVRNCHRGPRGSGRWATRSAAASHDLSLGHSCPARIKTLVRHGRLNLRRLFA